MQCRFKRRFEDLSFLPKLGFCCVSDLVVAEVWLSRLWLSCGGGVDFYIIYFIWALGGGVGGGGGIGWVIMSVRMVGRFVVVVVVEGRDVVDDWEDGEFW